MWSGRACVGRAHSATLHGISRTASIYKTTMDPEDELVLQRSIAALSENLTKVANEINDKLSNLTNNINRCQANLAILEKKIEHASSERDNSN